jgi:hypothetical protein
MRRNFFVLNALILIFSLLILTSCSKRNQASIKNIRKKHNINQIVKPKYLTMQDQSLKSALRFLEDIDHITYILDGEDVVIPNSTYKIYKFDDFVTYFEGVTDYKIDERMVSLDLVKIKPLLKKKIFNIFQKHIPINIKNGIVLKELFGMIQEKIDYSFLVDAQLEKFVSEPLKLNYRADSIGEFLEYLKNKFDLYIDIDNNKKIINIKRIKKEFFKFAIPFFQSQEQQVGGTTSVPNVQVSEILSELRLELDSLKSESTAQIMSENLPKDIFSYLVNNVSGTVTVVATPSYMKEAKRIIKRFRDNLMINVNVKFTIYTLKLNKEHSFGVDWSFLNIKSKQSIAGGISGQELKIDGGTSFAKEATSLAASANSGMIKLGVDSDNFTAGAAAGYLNRFGTVTDIKSFNVVTMNNFKIVQQLGTNQDFISKVTVSEVTDEKGNKTTTRTPEVTKINSGMNLVVVPRYEAITQKMTLKIVPIISSVTFETQTIDGNILKLPTESVTNLTNNVIVKKGEKIILSGIIQDEKSDNYKGLANEDAGMSIRGLFGQQADKISRVEIIVVIEADILE